MPAKLFSHSTSPYGSDITAQICYAARVSNPANQELQNGNDRLMRYLIKNAHWSPFEMANICLEITTTREISRQMIRHRSFSFQEFSQRYANINDINRDGCPTEPVVREARLQDTKNRQNSICVDDADLHARWRQRQEEVYKAAADAYNFAINAGIAKELARAVLPEGNTPSRLYMNGSVRSWIHYLQSRCDSSTQKEHRDVAHECMEEIAKVFPEIRNIVGDVAKN